LLDVGQDTSGGLFEKIHPINQNTGLNPSYDVVTVIYNNERYEDPLVVASPHNGLTAYSGLKIGEL
jgi:hypothetical protein